jgi:AmmeMemoRadiSam system protein B
LFYAGTPQKLKLQIKNCYTHKFGPGVLPKVVEKGPRNMIGLVSPHAGYMYSGPVAAHAYYNLAMDGRPEVVIILGPNHTGLGSGLSIINEGVWRTPLGDVEVDVEIANSIQQEVKIMDVDNKAHVQEHSIEVQLPFLQYLYNEAFKIVPICFLMQDLETCREIGEAIGNVLLGKNALIIASTDMTHYEPQEKAEKKDLKAIKNILELSEKQLFCSIEENNITMCGYGPSAAVIVASKMLGARNAQLLCYKTSGDMIREYSSVVGYASISITK